MQFRPFYCTQTQLNSNTESIAQAGRLIICTDSKSIYFCPSNGTATLVGKASDATTSEAGLMTTTMVTKLNGIATGATANTASSTTPKVAGTAAVGTETNYARGDHVHPLQTAVSGNAGTATKLANARTITLSGAVTGSTTFDGAADKTITTTLSNFDASKITSGTINIARLPAGALERCVVVADQTARFALTTATVQTGDTVKQTDTNTMYFVVDDTKLNQDAGYIVYTAGNATTANSANTAIQLTTSRTLNIQDADGTNTGTGASFNGTANATIKLPSTIKATLTGNASTATKATQDSAGQQINTTYIKGLSASGRTVTYTKGDNTTGTFTTQDTTYSTMGAATASAAGTSGLVPAPGSGKQLSFLRGDGTWVVPTNTTYGVATTTSNGLMSAADKTKLDGVAKNANNYTHPSATAYASGLYKITTNNLGHVTAATAVTKSDITGLGIPASDTHYASKNVVGATKTATTDTTTALTNGNVYLNSVENNAVTSGHKISGSGASTVTTDTSGNIIVSSTNTWTANALNTAGYVSAPTSSTANKVWKTDASGNPGWRDDANTTYSTMGAATASAAGTTGLVPAPGANKHLSFLRGDGTWVVPVSPYTSSPAANGTAAAGSSALYARGDHVHPALEWETIS